MANKRKPGTIPPRPQGNVPASVAAQQQAAYLKATQEAAARRRRLALVIAIVLVVAIVAAVVTIILVNKQRDDALDKPAPGSSTSATATTDDETPDDGQTDSGEPSDQATPTDQATGAIDPADVPDAPQGATATGGIQLGVTNGQLVPGGGVPVGVPVVDVTSDFICPICGTFEQLQGEALREKALAGQIILIEHPLGYLDVYSTTEYSTRAASAAVLVAAMDPTHYVAFTEQLWENQPEEGGPGLSDDELIALAKAAGVDRAVAALFPQMPMREWVEWATGIATNEEGFGGTPRIRLAATPDGDLQGWSTWYQAYADQDGQQVVTPGDLDAALENVIAGQPPNGTS
jgi:protein-disulfide isomerase